MSEEISFLIVIPTLNSFEKLKRFRKSLISQNFEKWRVVFVDGNSNKDHKDWLNACVESDQRFCVYYENNETKGIYPSMSYGAQFANKNDWIIFLGSDDWFYSKNSLVYIANKISQNSNEIEQKLIICGTQFIEKTTNDVIRINSVPNFRFISNKRLSKSIFFGYVPAHQSLCFSQSLLKKLMPYSTKYHLAADSELIFKMLTLNNFNIVFIKNILINIEAGGLSSRFLFKRLREVLLIYVNYFKFIFFIPLTLRYLRKILSRIKLFDVLNKLINFS
jgi:glycosyltransferase